MTKYNINILEIVSYLENHQPSTLEISMTEEQLFRQKNPLWARGYTRHDLMTVVYLYQMISAKHITNNHDTICDILYANHKKISEWTGLKDFMKIYLNASYGMGGVHGNVHGYSSYEKI